MLRSLARAVYFVAIMFACTGVALAETETISLNTTDVGVASRSSSELAKALPKALAQVLIKMSGDANIMDLPAFDSLSPNVNQLVESYRYFSIPSAIQKNALTLHVVFDEQALKQRLRDAGQVVWSKRRPLTLLWVAVPEGHDTLVLSSADQSALAEQVTTQAALRGMPIMLPVMDLADQSITAIAPIMPSDEGLMELAKRYHVDSVLAGVVTPDSSGKEQVQWQWVFKQNPTIWQATAANVGQALGDGIDEAANRMAAELAQSTPDSQTPVTLKVSGVEDLNDYVQIVNALRRLNHVAEVHVADMGDDAVLLSLRVNGSEDQLVSELNTVKHLAVETNNADQQHAADLYYYWGDPLKAKSLHNSIADTASNSAPKKGLIQ